jgi:hypothetical protein
MDRMTIVGCIFGGVLGFSLAFWLHRERVFTAGNIGLNFAIGLPVGMIAGLLPFAIFGRLLIPKSDRNLIDLKMPPVAVIAESNHLYAIRFANKDYQIAFETLNADVVV